MIGVEARPGAWPTPLQEDLLTATLAGPARALAAYRRWQSEVDLRRVDTGTYGLLPLLYLNLHEQTDDPLMKRLKGLYRMTWYKNRVLLAAGAKAVARLERAAVPTLILKGGALIFTCYPRAGARLIGDLDILVRGEHGRRAIGLLREAGFAAKGEWPLPLERMPEVWHAIGLEGPEGSFVDLHWQALRDPGQASLDDDLWAAAMPFELAGQPTRTLCPSDQLFHICFHGVEWSPHPPIRWVADAAMIVRSAGQRLDWDRLLELTLRHGGVPTLERALSYLRDRFEVPVPDRVIRHLEQAPAGRRARLMHRFRLRNDALSRLGLHYLHYRSTPLCRRSYLPLVGFARYLRVIWQVSRPWQLPLQVAARSWRRLAGWASASAGGEATGPPPEEQA